MDFVTLEHIKDQAERGAIEHLSKIGQSTKAIAIAVLPVIAEKGHNSLSLLGLWLPA